jgi:hypothetical protein
MSKTADGYMSYSTIPPGSFDGMFPPLSDMIKEDISMVKGALECASVEIDAREAFNRLMAELHVVTTSSENALKTKSAYLEDLCQIDKLLSSIDVPPAATVNRVSTLVGRVVQARDSILRVAAALEGRRV